MANPVIHIKDGYFFEVPKFLWSRHYKSRSEFPDVWIKLDPQFQHWEAERLHHGIVELAGRQAQLKTAEPHVEVPGFAELMEGYEHWLHHDHANAGKPLDVYLDEHAAKAQAELLAWKAANPTLVDYSAGSWR